MDYGLTENNVLEGVDSTCHCHEQRLLEGESTCDEASESDS